MLLAAKVKSSGSEGMHTPAGTILMLEVDLPQAAGTPGAQGGRLDIKHIAVRYDVDTKTVTRWHERKLIPSFKIGSNIYCKEADLDAMEERAKNQLRVLTVNQIPAAIRKAVLSSNLERQAA